MPREHEHDCNYKKLYEGSQSSLSDMASRQANALGRLGRIRSGIINTLKKNYSDLFGQAESLTGRRIIDGDDEIILAYLDSFIQKNISKSEKLDLSYLKNALESVGIPIKGDNPMVWAEQVHELRKNNMYLIKHTKVKNLSNHELVDQDISNSKVNMNDNADKPDVKKIDTDISENTLASLFSSEEDLESLPDNKNLSLETLFSDVELWDSDIPQTSNERWSPSPLRLKVDDVIKSPNVTNHNQIVKPELFDTKQKSRLKKIRVKAERPDDNSLDLPGKLLTTDNIDDKGMNEIYAFVSIARPVFIRDLVSIVGDRDRVEKWESIERSNISESKVRFIGAKMRHKMRGSLIIPDEGLRSKPKNSKQTWWWDAIERYRGSKLYEVAVLLHRVGDEIISYKFDESSAVVILNAPTGLVGIIITFSPITNDKSSDYISYVKCLEDMSKDRVHLICLLTTTAEKQSLDELINSTITYATEKNLTFSGPVIASYTWDFADDRGSSAKLVLE